jgi:hypothetical protein
MLKRSPGAGLPHSASEDTQFLLAPSAAKDAARLVEDVLL